MFKTLIIFDTPEDFTHPYLSRAIKGSNFLVANLPEIQIKKLNSTLQYDMICLEDVDKPIEDCLRLRSPEILDFKLEEKLKKIENKEKIELNNEENKMIDFLNEKFLITTESTTQILQNSFVSPQILKILQGSVHISNTGKFFIHQNLIYSHYLDEVFLWGQIERGKPYFSHDDNFLVIKKINITILYDLKNMNFKEFPVTDRIVFGKNILILDHILIELEENAKNFYTPIILKKEIKDSIDNKNDWADSNEEEIIEEEKIYLKKFEDIWFSPFSYEFVAVLDDKLTFFRFHDQDSDESKNESKNEKNNFPLNKPEIMKNPFSRTNEKNIDNLEKNIQRMNISSEMIKDIYFTPTRCYAIITKYVNNKLKYFIESYSDFVTVNELTDNLDLTFRFSKNSFIVGHGNSLSYYELKNNRFILMNTVKNVFSNIVDLFNDFYCCLSENDDLLFFKGKKLLSTYKNIFQNIISIKYSSSGLFISVYSSVQFSFFDSTGNFIWNKICGDLKTFTFLEIERINDKSKKRIKNVYENNKEDFFNLLGDKKNQSVRTFKKEEETLDEKRKKWLMFLCAL